MTGLTSLTLWGTVSILQKQLKNVCWVNLYFFNGPGSLTIDPSSLIQVGLAEAVSFCIPSVPLKSLTTDVFAFVSPNTC